MLKRVTKIAITLLASSAALAVFPLSPHTLDWKLEKYIDTEVRKEYYVSCKEAKRKGCHMFSFEKAVRVRWTQGVD